MNIYEKLLTIANELETVAKNLKVDMGKSSYKAVGEADILKAVKPLELKYGIYSYPYHRVIVESGVLENESVDYNTHEKVTRKNLYERIETTYRFINIEKPEEYIDIVSYGDGIDSQDKSVGKAMTYADKYALMKAYKIVTGDDPDQNPSQPLKSVQLKDERTQLIKQCDALGMNLEKVAFYFRKNITDLTNDEIKQAIEMQKKTQEKLK